MRILFIGPLPDPVTGQSLACKILLDALIAQGNEIDVVNLSKEDLSNGVGSSGRLKEVSSILKDVNSKKNKADIIYFTISESFLGNVKDLLVYLICLKRLSRMFIHLHGGSIRRLLFDKYPLLYKINKFFIRKMAGVIVLGNSHIPVFRDMIAPEKIRIVPNFAEDHLFLTATQIHDKFNEPAKLNLLFLSNLMYEKGFSELLDAFLGLSQHERESFSLNFAGAFESPRIERDFFVKIKGINQVTYHGIVHGAKKKALLGSSHIFCLPTNYLEGQPISILEAYASGCVVVTTTKGGIPDIFTEGVNGYSITPKSSESIKLVLKKILNSRDKLRSLAVSNNDFACKKFRVDQYNATLTKIMKSIGHSSE